MSDPSLPIYLDYAATTPIDPRVRDKMQPYLAELFGNPASRDHRYGWDAADAVEEARYHVANLINATPFEVIFTSCATESINLALKGLVAKTDGKRTGIITTVVEHQAVLETCRQLESERRIRVEYLPVDRLGNFDLDLLRRRCAEMQPLAVAVMHANNEIGNIYPIREAACAAHEAGALFFTDATQSAGKLPIDVRADRIDLLAFSAHKIYGPKGVGALFVRRGEPKIELAPLLSGGGQERGLRSGTLNVPGIVGFGEACRIAGQQREEEMTRLAILRDRFEQKVLASLSNGNINGDPTNRLPTITNLALSGIHATSLMRRMRTIAISTRSACSTGKHVRSHVLLALGCPDDIVDNSSRYSLGRFTNPDHVTSALHTIRSALRRTEIGH